MKKTPNTTTTDNMKHVQQRQRLIISAYHERDNGVFVPFLKRYVPSKDSYGTDGVEPVLPVP